MRNKGKKIICLLYLISTILLIGTASKAEEPMDGQIIDGSLLTSEDSASDLKDLILENPSEEDIIPYGTYLSNGSVNIQKDGSGIVYVSGATYCYRISDEVYVKLYLERLSNGSWSTIKTHTYTTYNSDYAYTGLNFSVAKGYYYRVRGYHYAKKGSTVESVSTCTNGIYIN